MLKACPLLFIIAILIQETSTSPIPSPTVDECVSFLKKWMPPQDKESLSDEFIESNVFYALEARRFVSTEVFVSKHHPSPIH